MKSYQLTTYFAKDQLLAELQAVKIQGRNARAMLTLDIDLCDSAETDLMLSEIEREFAYLEAGVCRIDDYPYYFNLFQFPCNRGFEQCCDQWRGAQ